MRHITTKNLASFCMDPDEGMWEMDGRPPEPSEIERAQAQAGHVMSETDIAEMKDILHRSGIHTESRNLDKFETLVTDIALRLIDEDDDMDTATAGMDILDAVNDRLMTESTRRAAGTWYDPLKRAMEILESTLPEDVFSDMKARMASQADKYLKDRDSDLRMATTTPSSEPEEIKKHTGLGGIAQSLERIRRLATQDDYKLSQRAIDELGEIINQLQQYDQMAAGGAGVRLKNLFGSLGIKESKNPFIVKRVLNEMCDACQYETEGSMPEGPAAIIAGAVRDIHEELKQLRDMLDRGMNDRIDDRLDSIAHHAKDIGEQVEGYEGMEFEEDIAELRKRSGIVEEEEQHDLRTMMNTQRHILGSVIPQLREIANYLVKDARGRDKLKDIADQLASLQWKIHGERERQFGQLWSDVERQDPLWGKV